jgi:hypothetical protein
VKPSDSEQMADGSKLAMTGIASDKLECISLEGVKEEVKKSEVDF